MQRVMASEHKLWWRHGYREHTVRGGIGISLVSKLCISLTCPSASILSNMCTQVSNGKGYKSCYSNSYV